MLDLLIALSALTVYLCIGLFHARLVYGKRRPSTVPLCGKPDGHRNRDLGFDRLYKIDARGHCMYDYHGQDRQCYGPDTQNQALGIACLSGLIWPIEWLIGVPKAVITAGHKDRLEETEAKLTEANERLRKLLEEDE